MRKNKLINNFFVLMTGSMFAQIITIIFTPVITRIYSPESIGNSNVIISLSAILLPLVTIGMHYAIVVSDNDRESNSISNMTRNITILFSIFLLFILNILPSSFFVYFKIPNENYCYPLILIIMLSSYVSIKTQLLMRHHEYKVISLGVFTCIIFTVVFKLLLPYFFQKEISFILSVVLGFFCQSVLLYRTTIKYDKCKNNFNEYKFLLLKYKRFPLFKMPQNIISMINMHLPIFLLGIQVSSNDVGYYVMARTILLIPITFFSQVVGDVLYPRFSEKVQRNENVFDLLYKSTALLLLLALIISMVIYFYGDYLFPLFLGSKWQDSGIYASYLLLWFVINFINRPFVALISPLKLDWILFVNSLLTISIMIIFFYCSSLMKLDVKDILIIYSIISFVPQFILMIYVFFKAYDLKRE